MYTWGASKLTVGGASKLTAAVHIIRKIISAIILIKSSLLPYIKQLRHAERGCGNLISITINYVMTTVFLAQ